MTARPASRGKGSGSLLSIRAFLRQRATLNVTPQTNCCGYDTTNVSRHASICCFIIETRLKPDVGTYSMLLRVTRRLLHTHLFTSR
jgi:hypothetical protein